jgi:putative phosphoesterase
MGDVVRRIGVLGDVHGDSQRLAAALEYFQSLVDLDALFCVGDVVNLDADTEGCCRLLQESGVVVVRGNHDRWFLENLGFYPAEDERPDRVSLPSRAYVASLPVLREFETVSGRMLLCHGLGENDMVGLYPGDDHASFHGSMVLWKLQATGGYRWIVNGHTHTRMVRKIDDLTVINAGSVCSDLRSGFCAIDFENAIAQFYDIDAALTVYPGERHDLK